MNLNKIHSHSFGNVCSTSEILCFLPYSQRERQLLIVCSVIDVVNPNRVFGGKIARAGSWAETKQTLLPSLFTNIRQIRVKPPIFILQNAWMCKLSWICYFWPAKATCKCGLAFKISSYRDSLASQSLMNLCSAVILLPNRCWCCRMSPKKKFWWFYF